MWCSSLSLEGGRLPLLPDSLRRLDWWRPDDLYLCENSDSLTGLNTLCLGPFTGLDKWRQWNLLQCLCTLHELECLGMDGKQLSLDLIPASLYQRLLCLDLDFDFHDPDDCELSSYAEASALESELVWIRNPYP